MYIPKPLENKVTISHLKKLKQDGEKFACLTAYDYSFARLVEECGVEVVLAVAVMPPLGGFAAVPPKPVLARKRAAGGRGGGRRGWTPRGSRPPGRGAAARRVAPRRRSGRCTTRARACAPST